MSRAISTNTWLFTCHIFIEMEMSKKGVVVKKTWRGSSPSSFVPGSGSDASVALTWQSQYEAEHGNVDDVAKVFGNLSTFLFLLLLPSLPLCPPLLRRSEPLLRRPSRLPFDLNITD